MEPGRRNVILVVAGALALTGCTAPAAEPTPSATAFADADAAYEAAEATYRSYVDALNEWRAGQTSGTEPNAFLYGEALDNEIEAQAQMNDLSLRVVGPSVVVSFVPVPTNTAPLTEVLAEVCLDSSATSVIDSDGSDVTPEGRESLTPLAVTFRKIGKDWAITRSTVGDHQC